MSTDANANPPSDAPASPDALLPLVYAQLRALAAARMAHERPGHTLNPTALVHEAYVRLADNSRFANRAHFFAAAAEAMRRILIDRARAKGRQKREGGRTKLPVDVLDLAASEDSDQILAVDDAIRRLDTVLPEAARVVRLRFFAGLSVAETAETLGTSERSVAREWTYARAWLLRELGDG
jgi:RNA polymerase sigma factor (TIGR02999 family)